ncbi:hypothetical protein HU200_048860 [Digitaria exilis]|uniref:Disease resistance N-terminal domain-containing protein n=1 Tax=Digitaria exilis TaxID=1010633 RepID=A0A835AX37_9POAL|nr:hypothetical protein HU200_048860 [Digitaria exilis]
MCGGQPLRRTDIMPTTPTPIQQLAYCCTILPGIGSSCSLRSPSATSQVTTDTLSDPERKRESKTMADPVLGLAKTTVGQLGLAKTTVEGTITMVRSAMEDEAKLKKSVQCDLLVISDEFEMMNSFLNDAKDHVTDNVTRTQVKHVCNTALDVEDCIEIILHPDNKPHW